jgi:hypothetical protein
MTEEKMSPLDRPGRSKSCKGELRRKPSIMERILGKREKGTKAVADYVFGNRHQILPLLEREPDRLTTSEWAVLRRLIRELEQRQAARTAGQERLEARMQEDRARRNAEYQERVRPILEAEDRAAAGARSSFPLSELRSIGLTPAEVRRAGDIRRPALRMTAAAAYLGVPKSRLDMWCKEGLVECSFTRSMAITGAGQVAARHFLPEDLDKIDIPAIEKRRKAMKGRGKLRVVG